MNNLEKLKQVFASCVGLDVKDVTESLSRDDVHGWDSISMVSLVNDLEDTFHVSFDIDDIIAFKTFGDIVHALEKEGVSLG